jgi:uncharacterized protein YjbJ (UPF0337 family)
MKINENTTEGKWLQIRGDIQKAWGKLTDDDIKKAEGNIKIIAGVIQQKYGETQKGVMEKLLDIFRQHGIKDLK